MSQSLREVSVEVKWILELLAVDLWTHLSWAHRLCVLELSVCRVLRLGLPAIVASVRPISFSGMKAVWIASHAQNQAVWLRAMRKIQAVTGAVPANVSISIV